MKNKSEQNKSPLKTVHIKCRCLTFIQFNNKSAQQNIIMDVQQVL